MSVRDHIEESAAHWLMRREEPDWAEDDAVELEAWLEQSLAHKAAFWRLEYGWRAADRIGALGQDLVVEPVDDDNVDKCVNRESSDVHLVSSIGNPVVRSSYLWRRWALAASLMATLGFGVSQFDSPFLQSDSSAGAQTFSTPIGGHDVLKLADGSRVELNTASKVRAVLGRQKREVWLDRGEAFFEVAHNAGSPFVVHAGARAITVLGTKFSVRRDGVKVTVSVLEGRVQIDDERDHRGLFAQVDPQRSTTITAGDIAIARGAATFVAADAPLQVQNALAWRKGMLNFDRQPLGEVAVEFNRYNRRKVVITDPVLATIRIGGSFQADNVDAFLRLLRDAYKLRVEENEGIVKIAG